MIKVEMCKYNYKKKPVGNQIGYITNIMDLVAATDKKLAELLTKGYPMRFGVGGKNIANWKSQQVFAVDIDDGITIGDAIETYSYLNPSFIYTTYSHSEMKHKFRMVFITEEEISDYEKAKTILLKLLQVIKESDKACKNLNRPFFGGKDIAYQDFSNRLNLDALEKVELDIRYGRNKKVMIKQTKKTEISDDSSYSQRIKAIEELNVEEMKILVQQNIENGTRFVDFEDGPELDIDGVITKRFIQELCFPEKEILDHNYIIDKRNLKYLLKHIDLSDYLGLPYDRNFNCLFHDDKNPSANIYLNDKNQWCYKCYSSNCEVYYDIIGVTMELASITYTKACDFLCDVYDILII